LARGETPSKVVSQPPVRLRQTDIGCRDALRKRGNIDRNLGNVVQI